MSARSELPLVTRADTSPRERNLDGRPIWEPPILNYDWLIGEEYDKQREAVLKHYNNDVVRTTKLLDLDAERDLLSEYRYWVNHNYNEDSGPSGDAFWFGLEREVSHDEDVVLYELLGLKVELWAREDGTYEVFNVSYGPSSSPPNISGYSDSHRSDRPSTVIKFPSYAGENQTDSRSFSEPKPHTAHPSINPPPQTTPYLPADTLLSPPGSDDTTPQPLDDAPTARFSSPPPSIKNTTRHPSPHLPLTAEQPPFMQATDISPLLPPPNVTEERGQDGVPFCVMCGCFCS